MNISFESWLEAFLDVMVEKGGMTLEEAKEIPLEALEFYYQDDLTPAQAAQNEINFAGVIL